MVSKKNKSVEQKRERIWLMSETFFQGLQIAGPAFSYLRLDQANRLGLDELFTLLSRNRLVVSDTQDQILHWHLFDLKKMVCLFHHCEIQERIGGPGEGETEKLVILPTARSPRWRDLRRDYRAWVIAGRN